MWLSKILFTDREQSHFGDLDGVRMTERRVTNEKRFYKKYSKTKVYRERE